MKTLWILVRTLGYTLIASGLLVAWAPFTFFERRARWPEALNWPQLVGGLCISLGVVTYAHCAWLFARRGQGTPVFFDPPQNLVRRGAYKWVRNPMYLALAAVVGGEALVMQSWHIGVYWVCLVCALHLIVRLHEEDGLRYRFGAIYEDYKREVPCWLLRKPRPSRETVAPLQIRSR